MIDPVLNLAQCIAVEDTAFRDADDRKDFAAAESHHQVTVLLQERFATTMPTTREGIAVLLEMVEATLALEAETSAEAAEFGAVAGRIRSAPPTLQDQSFLQFHAAHPEALFAFSDYAARLLRSAARAACRPSFAMAA